MKFYNIRDHIVNREADAIFKTKDHRPGGTMLDAFIIERIRQRKEQRDGERMPLRIDIPLGPPPVEPRPARHQKESEVDPHLVDFSI